MNNHATYALIAILAAVGILSVPDSFAQNVDDAVIDIEELGQTQIPLTLETDMDLYRYGSDILVTGHVADVRSDQTPVTMFVTSPVGNIIEARQLVPNSDGSFELVIKTDSNAWRHDGTFVIRAQYGAPSTINEISVELTGSMIIVNGYVMPAICGTDGLAEGEEICVLYEITGGSMTSVKANTKDVSLQFGIDATKDGRVMLYMSEDTISGIFLVFVDDQEWDDAVIDGNAVTVTFPAGTEKIELFGAYVIPEFGTVAALILAVATVSIIAVSTRSRLGLAPKY